MSFFDQVFVTPILNILIAFNKGLSFLGVPFAFGFAIIGLTLFIRALLAPLVHKQLASAKQIARLKPELDKLSKKYKDDKMQLQQKQMELYKKAGVNPAAGCLPLLIQMPLFYALFRVFFKAISSNGKGAALEAINNVLYSPVLKITSLDLNFFGFDLTTKPSQWQSAGFILLTIPLITGGLQYIQSQYMLSQSLPKSASRKGNAKKQEDDTAASMQKQMALISPIMFGFLSYNFPVGLALYWNTFTLFGILQQYLLHKKTRS